MLLRVGVLAVVAWWAAAQLGVLASAVPAQAAAGCPWPCDGVVTPFSPGGGGLGALPTPAEAIHLPSLISGAEAQIQSALP